MGPEELGEPGELVVDSFAIHLQRRHTRCCLHLPEKDQKDVERLTAAELLGLSQGTLGCHYRRNNLASRLVSVVVSGEEGQVHQSLGCQMDHRHNPHLSGFGPVQLGTSHSDRLGQMSLGPEPVVAKQAVAEAELVPNYLGQKLDVHCRLLTQKRESHRYRLG